MSREQDLRDSGVLLVDKPLEWTSHDVVAFIRGFGFKKVGHCGTLDPAATGLLVVVLGRATKLTDRLSSQDKVYEGTLQIGVQTDSHDAEGTIVHEADWSNVTPEQLKATFGEFLGEIDQIPPMLSAKKQGGKKLYELARAGIEVERQPRPITIHELTIDRIELPEVDFTVRCSKGTYVRTLCHDIGQKLGCHGFLRALRRTRSGRFHIGDAVTMDELRTWNRAKVLEEFTPLAAVLDYL